MNFSFFIWFGVGLVVYLTGLGIFTLIRFILSKRKFNKEVKEKEEEVTVIDTVKDSQNVEEE